MSDNYRNSNYNNKKDDIDDFFAQFDKPAQQPRQSQPRSSSARQPQAGRSQQPRQPQQRQAQPGRGQRSGRPQPDGRQAGGSPSAVNRRSGSSRKANEGRSATNHARNTAAHQASARTQSRSAEMAGKVRAKAASGKGAKGIKGGGGGGRKNIPQKKSKRILKLIGAACLALIMGVGIYVGIIIASAPKIDTDNLYDMLSQRSIMYDSEGNEIENLYFSDGNRTIVKYDDIPEDMVNAVVAIEDKKFWTHSGFNYIRMAGAVVDSVFGGGQISGTSTVTQQLARNVYLSDIKSQRSLSRKITEAYYTVILEKNMSKKEIMEAYLNTIYLGFNSYGIQSAAQAYFSKDVKDLTTLECASLAALPKSPDSYALVKTVDSGTSGITLPTIMTVGDVTYLYNGDLSKDRRDTVLKNMAEEGFITETERDDALSDDLFNHIKIGVATEASASSYFTDYAIDQLTEDIISEYGISRDEARNMIYTNGLKIYTTMDSKIQGIVESVFSKSSNFSGVSYVRTNKNGDILNESGRIMLYSYDHYFNDNHEFTLSSDEYKKNGDGSMTIYKGKRLNIYNVEVNGEAAVSIEFKGMYTKEKGTFYFIESGALSIPQGYTTTDGDGNAVISSKFFSDYPEFFTAKDSNYIVSSQNYTLKQKVKQPQAATVILENDTGEIKAMIGGRDVTGKQLFNRATSPRQPGSSIKPIGSYGPALQRSYELAKDNKPMNLDNSDGSDWGKYVTAGSVINDAPIKYNGRSWPKNWYSGYKGQMTLRHAVQQSVNTCAVKTWQQIGADYSAKMLKNVGVTTIDEEGEVNDLNPAALALGGMTNGISPLEVTAAYAVFPNGGVYKKPIAYTKVLNSNDEVLFEKKAEEEQVYNEGVAWIMTDILRTVVSEGIAGRASIGSQPVGGKTGTTSDNYDLWFAGFTPQYTAAVWMGNDVNMQLSGGSGVSASIWSNIMGQVCKGLPRATFGEKPSNVETVNGEYYVKGTYSKVTLTKTGDSTEQASSTAESVATTVSTAATEATTTETQTTQSPQEGQ